MWCRKSHSNVAKYATLEWAPSTLFFTSCSCFLLSLLKHRIDARLRDGFVDL